MKIKKMKIKKNASLAPLLFCNGGQTIETKNKWNSIFKVFIKIYMNESKKTHKFTRTD